MAADAVARLLGEASGVEKSAPDTDDEEPTGSENDARYSEAEADAVGGFMEALMSGDKDSAVEAWKTLKGFLDGD